MKKVIAVVAGMVVSFSAYSAPEDLVTGPVAIGDCALLAEGVRVSLSNNVLAAYNCEEIIQVSTCSTAGRTSQREGLIPCGDLTTTPPQPACATPGQMNVGTVTGSYIYTASSNGGTVTPVSIDGATCATGDLQSAIPDPA